MYVQYCSAYRERIVISAPLSGGIKRCEKIALGEIFASGLWRDLKCVNTAKILY